MPRRLFFVRDSRCDVVLIGSGTGGIMYGMANFGTLGANRLPLVLVAVFLLSFGSSHPAQGRGEGMPDEAIRRAMIAESITAYPSVCACPYSVMRNGAACGGRSAYSRPGGYSPICYPDQISPDMLVRWRSGR
jgi:hypothetical protein